MSHSLSSDQLPSSITPVPGAVSPLSIFQPPAHGWLPSKLPELATNGFPFSPTFIVRSTGEHRSSSTSASAVYPFGFHFKTDKTSHNQQVIDLTRGYYDPHTQVYTVPLRAGGETQGEAYITGYWSNLDGKKKWDLMNDYTTD